VNRRKFISLLGIGPFLKYASIPEVKKKLTDKETLSQINEILVEYIIPDVKNFIRYMDVQRELLDFVGRLTKNG
jgi:hypothetical protein